MRKTIISLVTIIAMAASSLAASPALAKDYDDDPTRPATAAKPTRPKGEPVASMRMEAGSKGNTTTQTLFCEMFWNPSPQYSASNNTIHYGVWVECNYTPALSLTVQIWVKPPIEAWEPADTPKVTNTVGFTGAAGGVTACFAGASGQWQARFWGTATPGTNFVPYPTNSQVRTYPCI